MDELIFSSKEGDSIDFFYLTSGSFKGQILVSVTDNMGYPTDKLIKIEELPELINQLQEFYNQLVKLKN